MRLDRQRFLDDLRYLATLNVKWLRQGRTVETGMDCIGPPRWAIERQGLHLPTKLLEEFDTYMCPPNGRRMLRLMRQWLIEIAEPEVRPSDLIVVFARKNPCHLTVQMEDGLLAEAFEGVGVSRFLIRPRDPQYRTAACFRIPDELDG